jgi:glycerol-3-phosphate acyltransferase PlsY
LVKIVITLIVSYLLGSISPAILLGKARGIDIKKEGSGNAGTTNVLRVMGGKAAIITLTVDILKGLLPALIFGHVFGDPVYGYLACLCAFIGHVFPVYYGFKGGKGVAVAFGGLLGVNWKIALLCLLTVVVLTLISKRMSVGSIAGAISAVPYTIWLEPKAIPYIAVMALLIVFMHRGNIKRLINHEEPPLGFLDKNKKKKEEKN